MSDEALIEAMAETAWERNREIVTNDGMEMPSWWQAKLDVKQRWRENQRAALAALRKTHAVVPREPSETIRRAGYSAIYGITRHDIVPSLVAERAVEAYRAMLNASEATDA